MAWNLQPGFSFGGIIGPKSGLLSEDESWMSRALEMAMTGTGQLKTLGNIVFGICELMKQDNPQVDIQECKTPGVERGVQFTVQGDSETYRWGNIPDFTKDIF